MKSRYAATAALFIVMIGVAWGVWMQRDVVLADADAAQVCQTYHVRDGLNTTLRVRECAGENCAVVAGITPADEICVTGLADSNADWFSVDVDGVSGFVRANLIDPGLPGLIDPNAYCDAYMPVNGDVVVRNDAVVGANTLGGLTDGETVCVNQYASDYIYWLGIENGGWVQIDDVAVYRGEIDCDGWVAEKPNVPVYACESFTCNVISELPQGEVFCVDREAGEDIEWLGFRYNADSLQTGWVYAPLLQDIEDPDPFAEGLAPTIEPTIVPYGQTVANVNLRANGSLLAEVIGVARENTNVLVIGANVEGWYYIQTQQGQEGWVAPNSVSLGRNVGDIPIVGADGAMAQTVSMQIVSTPSLFGEDSCVDYRVIVDSAVVRDASSVRSNIVDILPIGTDVCVVRGEAQSADWAYVRFTDEAGTVQEGFMSTVLITPLSGEPIPTTDPNAQAVAQVPTATAIAVATDVPLVAATATPLITPRPASEATPTPLGLISGSGAATLTPTPEVCAEGQVVGCLTPTPSGLSIFAPPTPELNTVLLAQDVPFTLLRLRDVRLESPQGNATFNFILPLDWELSGNNVLSLDLTYTENSEEKASVSNPSIDLSLLTSDLEVYLDGRLVSTLTLAKDDASTEPFTLEVPLPNDILNNNDFHRIELVFSAQDHCEALVDAAIDTIIDNSFFHFEYFEEKPLLDLASYPRPFFNQRPPTERESVVIVLPDQPTSADINAAAAISGGLGYLTQNSVEIRTRRASALSDFERDSSDLIMVGVPERHAMIQEYYALDLLPTTLTDAGIEADGTVYDTDDGIIQLATNPANDNLAVMVVTGMSDLALDKAAQALAGPPAVLGFGGPVIIVTEKRNLLRGDLDALRAESLTLRDLGQTEDVVLSGLGVSRYDIEFTIPPGTELDEDAYVEVFFNFSKLLENPNSSFTILINETPIESVVLGDLDDEAAVSEADAQGIRTLRAPITTGLVNPGGENFLTMIVNSATPEFECTTPDGDVIWFTIASTSSMYLPRKFAEAQPEENYVSNFPSPFANLPNLSDVWINLPAQPTDEELQQTFRFVSLLSGAVLNAEGIQPKINLGDLPTGTDTSQYHFIVVGRPTTNSLLYQLNELQVPAGDEYFSFDRPLLPQPFVSGTDDIEQVLDDVSYRLPPGYEVGILQQFDSPWSQTRKILLVTGTGERGQRDAMNALLSDEITPNDLFGDVVFVAGQAISYVDSRRIYSADELLQTALELPTEQAAINVIATESVNATATAIVEGTAGVPRISPTPLPTGTAVAEGDEIVLEVSSTPLITALPQATATPTVEPITDIDALSPPLPPRPPEVDYLIYATVGVVVTTLLGLAGRFFWMRRKKNQ